VRKRTLVLRGKEGNPCTIQDLYLDECLLGVRLAEMARSVGDLRQRLAEELPQNSPGTRLTYAGRICNWLCPSGLLDSAPLLVWRAYQDEQMLLDHFRVRYLEAVPLLARFVSGPLSLVDVGATLDSDTVRAFVARECGDVVPKTIERLPLNLVRLGFLARASKRLRRTSPLYDPTSVVLELHRVFAQTPTTTSFAEVVAHPFWRYLGVPDTITLESILYGAVAKRLLTKFVKSDELNQVTVGHSYAEFLELRLRM